MNSLVMVVLGLIGFGVIDLVCIRAVTPAVEKDLLVRAAVVLQQNQIPSAGMSFNGRDALLTGVKGAPEVSDHARQLVSSVDGVRTVTTEFVAPTAILVSPVEAKISTVLDLHPVDFIGNSDKLAAGGKAALDAIASILIGAPQTRVEIHGPGRRTAAVTQYLASKGVAHSRLSTADAPGEKGIEFVLTEGK